MDSSKRLCSLVRQSCDPWQEGLWEAGDARYARSFSVEDSSDAPREFFDRFGFVVFHDVLTAGESAASADSIFSLCEQGTAGRFQRGDPASWRHFPQEGMEKYGCPTREPAMSEVMLRNRANPRVHAAFARLLGEEDLLCNHDRVCLQRPTRGEHGSEGYSTNSNLHLDMNPWHYMSEASSARQALDGLRYRSTRDFFAENNAVFAGDGLQLQGVLNLHDNFEEDGGFWCVPGFARAFEEVFGALPMPRGQAEAPSLSFDPRRSEGGEVFGLLRRLAMRVPMRAGSMVVWDQRTPHGACRNSSARPRLAQFLKLFPRRLVAPQRLSRRAALLQRELRGLPRDLLRSSVFGLGAFEAPRPALCDCTAAMPASKKWQRRDGGDALRRHGQSTAEEDKPSRRDSGVLELAVEPAEVASGAVHAVQALSEDTASQVANEVGADQLAAPGDEAHAEHLRRRWRPRGGRSGFKRRWDSKHEAAPE